MSAFSRQCTQRSSSTDSLSRVRRARRQYTVEMLEDRTLLTGISGFNGGNGWTQNTNNTGGPVFVGDSVILTDGNNNEARSAIYDAPQPISTWSASWDYQLTQPGARADGATFMLENQASNPTNALGQDGGGLGYANINNSIAIKLDFYSNDGEGTNSTGYYTNGTYPSNASDNNNKTVNLDGTGIKLLSGDLLNVAMSYDGTNLNVTITDTVTGGTAYQSYAVNIPAIVGASSAYVGFTGATGDGISTQTVSNFSFQGPGTAVALNSSANPSTSGQSVTFTATVAATPPATGTPTGTVDFLDGTTTLGSGTLNSSGVATYSTTSLAVGTHSITAAYQGDQTFAAGTSAPVSQIVSAAATTTVLNSSLNPSTFNQTITFVATVTSSAGTPSGTMDFLDGTNVIGTAPLNGSGVAVYSTSTLASGTHSITAAYEGSGNFSSSTSVSTSQVVNPVTTATALVSSLNPISFGQAVGFTATVTSSLGPPTGGTVTFFDGGSPLGSGTVSSTGVATFLTTTYLTAGTHAITATYVGSTNYGPSTSAAVFQVVNPATTVTLLTTTVNPSTFTQTVTFTANVTSPAGPLDGTVNFLDGTTLIGSVPLSNGAASLTTSLLAVGTHPIMAAYQGNQNFAPSASAPISQVVNPLPTVNIGPATMTVPEAGGTGTITATLSAVSTLATIVTISFAGGAVLGTNFDTSIDGSPLDSTTLTIPAGSLSGQVTLIGKLDGKYGPDLTVNVGIASTVNGIPGGSTVEVTFPEGDPKPVVSISPPTSTLAEMGGSATFAVTMNEVSGVDTSVTFSYGGTATLGTDFSIAGNNYNPTTKTLVIPAGMTLGQITLFGLNNQTFGPDLTAAVTMQSAVNAAISAIPTSIATITEGNPGPTVSLALTGSPMPEVGGQALVTASIAKPYATDVRIFLNFTGSAVLGVNYSASGTYFDPTTNSLLIPAGATSSTLVLQALDDGRYGPNLNTVVSIQSLTPGIAPGGPVTAIITEGDAPPTVNLNESTSSISENGGQVVITATLSAPSGLDTTVPLTFTGTAAYGTNYIVVSQAYNPNTQSLLIKAGQTSASLLLIGQSDGQYGPNLTVVIGVGPTGPVLTSSPLNVLIVESSPPPQLMVSNIGLSEAAGTAVFTVVLSEPSLLPVNVSYNTFDISAVAGVDYQSTSGTLTFAPVLPSRPSPFPSWMTTSTDRPASSSGCSSMWVPTPRRARSRPQPHSLRPTPNRK